MPPFSWPKTVSGLRELELDTLIVTTSISIYGSISISPPLPVNSGGTGLATVGPAGQVLTSNGTGLYFANPAYITPTDFITTSTENATGATNGTGAIQANYGGVGIGLDLWVGGKIFTDHVTNIGTTDFTLQIENKMMTIAAGILLPPVLVDDEEIFPAFPDQIIIATSHMESGSLPPLPETPPNVGGNIYIQTGQWIYSPTEKVPILSPTTPSPSTTYTGSIYLLAAQALKLTSFDDMILYAQAVIEMRAIADITIDAGGIVDITGVGDVSIDGGAKVSIKSFLQLSVSSGTVMNIDSGGEMSISSGAALNVASTGEITIDCGGTLDLTCAGVLTIDAAANLDITCAGVLTIDAAANLDITCAGVLTIDAAVNLDIVCAGILTIDANGTFVLSCAGLLTIDAGAELLINAAALITIDAAANLDITCGGVMAINAATNLDLITGAFSLDTAGIATLNSGGALTITSGAALDITGTGVLTIDALAELTVTAAAVLTIDAAANLDITCAGVLTIDAAANLDITCAGVLTIDAAANLDITCAGVLTIDAAANLDINCGALLAIDSTGAITVNAAGALTLTGVVSADLTSAGFLNITSTGTLDLTSTALLTINALAALTINAGGAMAIDAAAALTVNSAGAMAIDSAVGLTINAGAAMAIDAAGALTINAGAAMAIDAVGALTINAGAVMAIDAAAALTINSVGAMAIDSVVGLTMNAGAAMAIDAGGALTINAGAAIAIDAGAALTINTVGAMAIDAGAVMTINAGGAMAIDAGAAMTINTVGAMAIDAGGAMSLNATGLIAVDTIGAVTITAGGASTITASGLLTMTTIGAIFINAGLTANVSTVGLLSLNGGAIVSINSVLSMNITSLVAMTISAMIPVVGNIIIQSAVESRMSSVGTIFLTTEGLVLPGFGNIFIECLGGNGSVTVRSAANGGASFGGGSLGTQIGYNPPATSVALGVTSIRGTGVSITTEHFGISLTTFGGNSVSVDQGPLLLDTNPFSTTFTTGALLGVATSNKTIDDNSLTTNPLVATVYFGGLIVNSPASITTTNASTLYIDSAPIPGTGATFTNSYALYVNTGASYFGGPVNIPNIVNGLQTIVSSAGTTTLTSSSPFITVITGSTTQTIVMPAVGTLTAGTQYTINNNSTGGGVVVKDASLTIITSIPVGGDILLTLLGSGSWDFHFNTPSNTSWGTATLSTASIIQSSDSLVVSNFRLPGATLLSLTQPSLNTSSQNYTILGVSQTSLNSAFTTFFYTGAANVLNYYGVGLYGSANSLQVYAATTASVSKTTGALVVTGGLGVSGQTSANSLVLTNALAPASGGTGLSTVGSNTQVLTSNGTTLFWNTPTTGTVTSVSSSVPSFMSVTVLTPTTTPAVNITLSGTALPVSSGGTGLTAVGSNTQVLTSNGTTLLWATPTTGTVTTVSASTPPFLSVAVGTPSTTPSIAITYSGTALPVANGGTGATTATGSGSVVLATSPTIATSLTVSTTVSTSSTAVSVLAPSLGAGAAVAQVIGQSTTTGNSLYQGFVYTSNNSPSNYYGMGLYGANALLIYTAGTASTTTSTGAVQVVGGLGVSGAINAASINVGTLVISSPLPILSGGTGTITSTGTGSVVLQNSPTINTLLTVNGTLTVSGTPISIMTAPSLNVGNAVGRVFGVASSTNNSIYDVFSYIGSGSASNNWFLQFAGSGSSITVFPSTTASTSKTTGTLVVTGGLGVSGDVYGNTFNIVNSTATSINYLQLFTASQGVGIGNNLVFGQSLSTNNAGVIQFVYAGGSGSTSNYLGLGTYGLNNLTLAATGVTKCFGGVNSTSTTTGTFVVTGGIGASGDVYCANLTGNLPLLTVSNPTVTSSLFQIGSILLPSATAGAGVQLFQGVSSTVSGNGKVGTFVYNGSGSASNFYGTSIVNSAYSTKVFASSTASTSSTTGTLVVTGGVGLSGDVFLGGSVNAGGTVTSTGYVKTLDTFQLVNTSSSSVNYLSLLTANMSVGIGNNLIFGQSLSTNNAGVVQFVYAGGSGSTSNYLGLGTFGLNNLTLAATGVTKCFGGVNSTSTTTGTFVVTGGIGVSATAYFGGDVHGNVGLFNNLTTNGGTDYFGYSTTSLTPVMSGASGAINGLTYSLQTATMVRIGRMTFIFFNVTFSYTNSSVTGNNMVMSFGSIPSITGGSGTCNSDVSNIASTSTPYVITPLGSSTLQFWSGVNPLQWQVIANTNQRLNGMFTYLN